MPWGGSEVHMLKKGTGLCLAKGQGLTLIEILFSIMILTSLLIGILSLLIYCINLQDNSQNTTRVANQMREKLEEIKAMDFAVLASTYATTQTVNLNGVNGSMRIEILRDGGNLYVTGSNNNLMNIRIVAGWIQKGGRIIGEGINSGGNFTFSDLNSNAVIESPLEFVTAVAKRQ